MAGVILKINGNVIESGLDTYREKVLTKIKEIQKSTLLKVESSLDAYKEKVAALQADEDFIASEEQVKLEIDFNLHLEVETNAEEGKENLCEKKGASGSKISYIEFNDTTEAYKEE